VQSVSAVLFWNCTSGGQVEAGPLQELTGRCWHTQPEPATLSQHTAREKKKGSITPLVSDRWKSAAHFHISHCESTNSGQIILEPNASTVYRISGQKGIVQH